MDETGAAVQQGPFAGMTIIRDSSWHARNVLQKLLGTYEQELHEAIESSLSSQPDLFINVGCAEGYYAVGFAFRVPAATVHVFDTDAVALEVCERAAIANRAECNLRLEQRCSGEHVALMLSRYQRAVVFVDCGGCETSLFANLNPQDVARAIFIIKMHDYLHPGTTEMLLSRFSKSHRVQTIVQGARNPHEIPILRGISEDLQWLAVSEERPQTMSWLHAVPTTWSH